MNPYDFVRVDWDTHPVRRPPAHWDRISGLAGRLEGRIIAETPFLIKAGARDADANARHADLEGSFVRNAEGVEIIPGSALKGLIRSLVETVGNGCWHHFKGRYRTFPERRGDRQQLNLYSHLPMEFHPCQNKDSLCIACRLFGFTGGRRNVFAGGIFFNDASCIVKQPTAAGYVPPLMPPKPRHAAWYTPDEKRLAGRKFYFHQARVQMTPYDQDGSGRKVQPVGRGSQFEFSAEFSQVDEQDWPFLLYALVLEDSMRHKFGYGKPAGLGSVRFELTRLEFVDLATRHRSGEGKTVYEGEELQRYVRDRIADIVNDRENVTLQDLRRIWAWPPAPRAYAYPTRRWFNQHPQAPIEATGG